MNSRSTFAVLAVTLVTVLSGCSGKPSDSGNGTPALDSGKGAINGLLIDDIFRPIPNGIVLLKELGFTATADELGQFSFLNLDPGSYTLLVQAPGHEAAPTGVDVTAGQYAEPQVIARRIFSDAGNIITTAFSGFIPCAVNYVENGYDIDCLNDNSGDSWRPGFTTDTRSYGRNITYLVTEVKVNQVGSWIFEVREDNGSSGGGVRYCVLLMNATDYGRCVNPLGVKNTAGDAQRRNVPWNNTKKYATLLFLNGQGQGESQSVVDQLCAAQGGPGGPGGSNVCRTTTGAGAAFGIRSKFLQSIFLGPTTVDISTYHVYSPSQPS
jgi:hypothetical protein